MLRRYTISLFLAAAAIAVSPQAGAEQAVRSAPLHRAADGHYLTPVTLNGEGPFDFVVDTAASSTVLSIGFAEKRHLPIAPTQALVQGVSGQQTVSLYTIASIENPTFSATNIAVAAMPATATTRPDGVLGMQVFREDRLEFDLVEQKLKAGPSGPAPLGFTVAPAAKIHGALMIIDVIVDGVKAKALFDSGARRTIINPALQTALGVDTGKLPPDEPLRGATGHATPAYKGKINKIIAAGATFANADVVFADAPVFKVLGLGGEPGMILGINVLSRAKAFAIDYPRSEVQIRR